MRVRAGGDTPAMKPLDRWKRWARRFKVDVFAVYLAARDPRVPWYAKALAIAVAAYAFSPIDLIPDFIPVLGYLDDLVVVPLGIALVVRLVPDAVWADCKAKASTREREPDRRLGVTAAIAVVLVWLAVGVLAWRALAAG